MLSSFDSFSNSRNETHIASALGVFLLRLGAGFVLFYVEGWQLAQQAWHHLWEGSSWTFIDTLTQAQMPLPKWFAIAIALVIVLGSLAWILGFVTRFASAVMIPVMAISILVANRTGAGITTAETAALYFFIALCLLITGPGWCSMDALFKLRRKKKSIYV